MTRYYRLEGIETLIYSVIKEKCGGSVEGSEEIYGDEENAAKIKRLELALRLGAVKERKAEGVMHFLNEIINCS